MLFHQSGFQEQLDRRVQIDNGILGFCCRWSMEVLTKPKAFRTKASKSSSLCPPFLLPATCVP